MTYREYQVEHARIELDRACAALEARKLRVKEAQMEVKDAEADVAQANLRIKTFTGKPTF